MYLQSISEFVLFLQSRNLSKQEILDHLARVVFKSIAIEAITMAELNNENLIKLTTSSGISESTFDNYEMEHTLSEKYPITDSLLNSRITWIDTLPEWGDDYPLLKNLPWPTSAKTFICIPISLFGTPVAAISLTSFDLLEPTVDFEAYLKIVGSLLSIVFYRDSPANSERLKMLLSRSDLTKSQESWKSLSERQLIILRLISELRTNKAISGMIGYSESTVRQEIMKIFAILKVTNRKDAGVLFNQIPSN